MKSISDTLSFLADHGGFIRLQLKSSSYKKKTKKSMQFANCDIFNLLKMNN